MLGELVVVAALAALTGMYWRVPAGPECPCCGALAREGRGLGPSRPLDRLLIAVRCPVCGWDGHMRRRPPLAMVARRRGGRP